MCESVIFVCGSVNRTQAARDQSPDLMLSGALEMWPLSLFIHGRISLCRRISTAFVARFTGTCVSVLCLSVC